MFKLRNIDDFIPHRFETIGMLKGKRWYIDSKNYARALFKPKRNEFGDRKVFCANHYGEFVGYLLAKYSDILACKSELAHLSKYYKNIHKFRNNGTPEEKDGCISYSMLKENDILKHGKIIIDSFSSKKSNIFNELTKNDNALNKSDNLEVVLASVEDITRTFYKEKNNCPETYIEKKVKQNRADVIQMIVYDCLYGNNDRHDENWGLKINDEDISLYPLYDNERVLGLYENQNVIEKALNSNAVDKISEKMLFSRMRVPGDKSKHSSYKNVLNYLIQNYNEETKVALDKILSAVTPDRVRGILEECEGLPKCYVDFGTQMYESRYNFAKDLYQNKKINSAINVKINFDTYNISNPRKLVGDGR